MHRLGNPFLYTIVFIAFLLSACKLFGVGDGVHMAKAEIGDIGYQSDTSVVVRINTFKKSSAYTDCKLYLAVDTIAREPFNPPMYIISNVCDLDKYYDVPVGGLIKGKTYIFQLFNSGTFDIGSPKTTRDSKEIARQEYTMP